MPLKARIALAVTVLVAIGLLVSLSVFRSMAVYVTVIGVGLAVALQKYVASFFGYFVIYYTKILGIGDRIRIGTIKGDVRHIGFFHLTLEEVGEDEKLGGELTGRLLHVPNLIVLDQPVLNYSKDYSLGDRVIRSDYIFDEVRIPISSESDVDRATQLLEEIIRREDHTYVEQAVALFEPEYPEFLQEAQRGPRVLIAVEPQRVWLKGKFVAPVHGRNELRTQIAMSFLRESRNGAANGSEGRPIKLA
ncbi:MAG: mechanosensitive ion channel [Chloroflexi bacterium]|nr:mechanosensitive ion channel [Chloroflexota bacterium]